MTVPRRPKGKVTAAPMIPQGVVHGLETLVRDRDRWKRKALDRAAVRSTDRKREIAARDDAVRTLLYAVWVEGLTSHCSRGARGCVWDAIKVLRPDIAETMENGLDDAHDALRRFFPKPEDDA